MNPRAVMSNPDHPNRLAETRSCEWCARFYRPWHPKQRFCTRWCFRQHVRERAKPPLPTTAEVQAEVRAAFARLSAHTEEASE